MARIARVIGNVKGHFKICRNLTWAFIKTVESDVKVLFKSIVTT